MNLDKVLRDMVTHHDKLRSSGLPPLTDVTPIQRAGIRIKKLITDKIVEKADEGSLRCSGCTWIQLDQVKEVVKKL